MQGVLDAEGLFPHLEDEPKTGFFRWDFGLPELPRESGVIVVRGPRQFGKSTWLEHQLRETLGGDTAGGPLEDRVADALGVRDAVKQGGRDAGRGVQRSERPSS
ncbi:MAG: hypothetical protein ACREM1_11755 [Longimicrobiales bacterium]